MTIEEFEKVVEKMRPEWEKVQEQKKCHVKTACIGRQNTLYNSILSNLHNAPILELTIQLS
uniref:Uncharacterized protein n=1 Tax=Wolbachia endosymbiont of Aleurodicus dispersus TaxID=1288877 RepID=A0A3B0IUZ2_9RICK